MSFVVSWIRNVHQGITNPTDSRITDSTLNWGIIKSSLEFYLALHPNFENVSASHDSLKLSVTVFDKDSSHLVLDVVVVVVDCHTKSMDANL